MLVALAMGVLLAGTSAGPAVAALPRPVGGPLVIDVPAPAGDRLFDVNPFRAGTQVLALALEDTRAHRLKLVSVLDLRLLAVTAADGFSPRGSLGAGWRAFVWGENALGQARLWAPAFDQERSFLSLDPVLSCGGAADAATPLAGPLSAVIPAGARPGGQTVASPADAFVLGNPADPARGVRIRTAGGVDLGVTGTGTNVARGGFALAGAVFAYGTAGGAPRLWTPELIARSTKLRSLAFLPCTEAPPAQGTITVTKTLVPAADPGRFDLQIDGAAAAAGVGDGGTTGPVTVPAGEHTIAETAAAGSSLDDYTTAIECAEDTNPRSPVTGTDAGPLTVPVAAGDEWRCTVTNERLIDPGSLTVQSSPDPARAASQEVGPLGATIEATGADGTRYSLFVPPGALADPVEITVTPTAVSGLEAIATAAPFAVELAPGGLAFATPARLTITPAAGAAVDFAASWQDTGPGVEILPQRANPDGTLVVDVAHFSGVASIQATIHAYNRMLTLALVQLPDYQGLKQQLVTDVTNLPGSAAAVAGDVQQIYTNHVLPYLNDTDTGIVELQVASRRLAELEAIYQLLPIGAIPVGTGTLQDLLGGATGLFTTKATALLARYTTSCDGPVNDLADWFAIPILAAGELNLRGAGLTPAYCARAAIDTITWATRIQPSDTTVPGALRGVIEAPAHTPGGILEDGKKLFPQPTELDLHVTGATFPGGLGDLDQITPDDGVSRLDFQLDRQNGGQSVTVTGTGHVFGFTAEIIKVDSTFENLLPVRLGATTGTVTVAFRSPPTNEILPFGQTTSLCVDVYDGDSTVIAGETATWTLTGPGSLAATTSTTNSLGVACVDYHHPAGPVTQGDTARIQASVTHNGDTGSASVTLTPDWAHIEIETRAEIWNPGGTDYLEPSFRVSTNGSRAVDYNHYVNLRVTVTGPGATPSAPPRPLAEGHLVQVEIVQGGTDHGRFELTDPDGSFRWGTSVLAFVDANGQALLHWDPVYWDPDTGTTGLPPETDVTIRVTYPDTTLFNGGATATVTFAIVLPPNNPCTPPNCYL